MQPPNSRSRLTLARVRRSEQLAVRERGRAEAGVEQEQPAVQRLAAQWAAAMRDLINSFEEATTLLTITSTTGSSPSTSFAFTDAAVRQCRSTQCAYFTSGHVP